MYRPAVILSLAVVAAATAARADEFQAKGLAYRDATITGVKNCSLQFHPSGGAARGPSAKWLGGVTSIRIDGEEEFNQAEELAAKGKLDEAIRLYNLAGRATTRNWLEDLLPFRRLLAYNKAKRIDGAVGEWLTIVEASDASAESLKFVPDAFGEVGSETNAAAIKLLADGLKEIDNKAFAAARAHLLMKLYRHEGRDEEAAKIAEWLAGAGDGEDRPLKRTGTTQTRLAAAKVLLGQAGKAGDVIKVITADLDQYESEQLPGALLLLGKAQSMAAQQADDAEARRSFLLEAGLHLMEVATYFGESGEAAEALYLAAEVTEALDNKAAARRGFDAVRTRYSDSAFAAKAGQAIERLDKE